ncbi:MAG: sigma-54-dependent Fis family transcriptional regulator [Melioribacteraceae bacterium]|nr:sigma-54-dependent Fis family transcriptional regulator [Melioribacteraceae bacterium]
MTEALYPRLPILIVDDEQIALDSLEMVLNAEGITNIILCNDSRDVMEYLATQQIGIVLTDINMPHVSGEEILESIVDKYPEVPVIMVTGVNEVETTVRCIKSTAYDYIVKPVDDHRLITTVLRAIDFRDLKSEVNSLKEHLFGDSLDKPEDFKKIVTQNKKMLSIFQYIEAVSKSSQALLITGETGVGKELFAEAIHKSSGRKGKFVALNIAGLDENMFSDTLFGHKKGAFTGAEGDREGLIEKAAGGTIFLDEIGDLKPEFQVKLLRLIEAREYFPLGADIPKHTDTRVVVATNKNLKELSKSDEFRSDLYFRLSSHQIKIPPLRDRFDDLPLLLDHFLQLAADDMNKKKPTPPEELTMLLSTYQFPGNLRELKAVVFDAVANHKSKMLNMRIFREYLKENGSGSEPVIIPQSKKESISVSGWENLPTIKQITLLLIKEAMSRTNNNQSISGQILGITRQTLMKYLKQSEEEQE